MDDSQVEGGELAAAVVRHRSADPATSPPRDDARRHSEPAVLQDRQSEVRFHSILYRCDAEEPPRDDARPPAFFRDLNLDQLFATVASGYEEYELAPFFAHRLPSIDAAVYRQDVMRELEASQLLPAIKRFSALMRDTRTRLAKPQSSQFKAERDGRFLRAVQSYCAAIDHLTTTFRSISFQSTGLRALKAFVEPYAGSPTYRDLSVDASRVAQELDAVRYGLVIRDASVTVQRYAGEPDLGAIAATTFDRFREEDAKDYRVHFAESSFMNHIEGQIVERVAKLFPDAFAALDAFVARHADFIDATIARFDREVQFYIAYLDYVRPLREHGFAFCYPSLSTTSKAVRGRETFDIALARHLVDRGDPAVANDFFLQDPERILVVSGPNQGGKTTFARTFGQMHYLASLGCAVAGSEAKLFFYDQLFTHFERDEDLSNLRGKLHDELVRIHDVLLRATGDSIVIMNEIFSSTTLKDAVILGTKVMQRISQLDLLAVCVTFIDELTAFDAKTVSVVSGTDPKDASVRTFRIERRTSDGKAQALALARRHGVTYDDLVRRIGA